MTEINAVDAPVDAPVAEVTKTRKPRAKKIVDAPVTEATVEAVAEPAAQEEEVAGKFSSLLKGKNMWELLRMHDQAILDEDAAKRELHVMRQRAANMATTVDDVVDREVADAKAKVAEAIEWLHAIERRLVHVPRDIWGSRYGRS